MRKRCSYLIAGEYFKTRKEIQSRIQNILYKYLDHEHLSSKDFLFMLEVLKLHPDSEQKIGEGVKAIYTKQNPIYKNNRNFWLIRNNNTETDFSYIECLKETSHQKRFINACRASLEPYIITFKRNFFLSSKHPLCPITGKLLSFNNCHVDHIAPNTFQQIVNNFINEFKIDINTIKIKGKKEDNIFQDTFEDKKLEEKWINYHNNHAKLQIVSPIANLSVLKKTDDYAK